MRQGCVVLNLKSHIPHMINFKSKPNPKLNHTSVSGGVLAVLKFFRRL